MKRYGIIMAGGNGTRFWPLSREKKPKQLLNITGKDIMINETIERLSYIANDENIYITTSKTLEKEISKITKNKVLEDNILVEPELRNTTACIGFSLIQILKQKENGVMIIVPSDSYIENNNMFVRTLNQAVELAEKSDKLVIIGIKPTYPSTGYGYIKFDTNIPTNVIEFTEKPDEKRAECYINSGNYLWNSGMIIAKSDVILDKIRRYAPNIYNDLIIIKENLDKEDIIEKIYSKIEKISFDYAVLEPSSKDGDILVLKGEFKWSDVGTWDSFSDITKKDEYQNTIIGDVVSIDTTNCIVHSSDKLIATVGVDNLVIIETEDSILICNKDNSQDVKKVIDKLNEINRTDLI